MSILELERNDVKGAVKAYRETVETALTWQQVVDAARTLMMLQDDPTELDEKLDAVAREPRIAGRLRQLERDRDKT